MVKVLKKTIKFIIMEYKEIFCIFFLRKQKIRREVMNFKKQQEKFDDVKWFDSIQAGSDKCGSYEFCGECRKSEPYPCARAAHRHANGYIRIAVIRRYT